MVAGSGGAVFKDTVRWHHAGRGREVKLYKSEERFREEMHREGKEERESEEVRCRAEMGLVEELGRRTGGKHP